MLTRITMRQSMRQLSFAANRLSYDDLDERIYRENYIKYNKYESSFSEHTRTFYTDDRLKHHCIRDTGIRDTDIGSICQKCKGSGLIYPKYRIAKGPSDYRLCEMCRGSGFR